LLLFVLHSIFIADLKKTNQAIIIMYICICKGITDKAIIQSIESGATSFRKVRNSLGVATECGQCACDAKKLISDTLEEQGSLETAGLFYSAG
jgi:bacterioferritin-associated ferredoxin